MEGRVTGLLDQRLEVYRHNASRVPHMTGLVIPEAVFTRAEYERAILSPLGAAVAELEPTGTLEGEWLNARGAIARFDRDALEVRLIDAQECPRADVAVAWAVTCAIAALCAERDASFAAQREFASEPLAALLVDAIRAGRAARLADPAHARALGWKRASLPTLGELWDHLVETVVAPHPETDAELLAPLQTILRHGTLSERILRTLGPSPSRTRLHETYRDLCACLEEGRLFRDE
jgi:gamma-glutamyl:cysteine ligase YbdK (ATP-grasp superfamily)